MNNKLFTALVILAVALGGYGAFKPVKQVIEQNLGSNPNFSDQQRLNFGGVKYAYRHRDFAGTSTSTPCSFQVTSTSTLVYASLRIGTATSTATVWTVAKANGSNATTTVLTTFPSLASGAQGTMVATTTPGTEVAGSTPKPAIDGAVVFGPNQYLVWGVSGLTYTGYDSTLLGGTCDAVFVVNS